MFGNRGIKVKENLMKLNFNKFVV